MVKLSLEMKKRDLVWVVPLIVVLVVGFVVAYNVNYPVDDGIEPIVHGHTLDEINGSLSASGGGMEFGDWTDSIADAVAGNGQGPALTDGFVVAYGGDGGGTDPVKGYTPEDTKRTANSYPNPGGTESSISMPVKAGDTWKVIGANYVYWIPIVSGGSSGSNLEYVCEQGDTPNPTCSAGKTIIWAVAGPGDISTNFCDDKMWGTEAQYATLYGPCIGQTSCSADVTGNVAIAILCQ